MYVFLCYIQLKVETNIYVQTLGVQAAVIILPTIGEALNIPTSRQQWIVSAYNLTFGCFLVRFFTMRTLICIYEMLTFASYCGGD